MFQSAPPARGATGDSLLRGSTCDVSIRAPRTGGDTRQISVGPGPLVSIRAPRTGGDWSSPRHRPWWTGFNPRPPHGGRPSRAYGPALACKFQSAPPARGATRQGLSVLLQHLRVSIRAPRTGGDFAHFADALLRVMFQSAPPARGATADTRRVDGPHKVSIRAPRTGGDHYELFACVAKEQFQSAPPARGATGVHLW